MSAYYNEIEPYAAQWLRNLIAAGHIAPGDVDERSIADVQPDDLEGYTQAHFFAGIGVWSYSLRLAGWPDDRPVWTGSCPCQPFSAAGRGEGFADERHLWPAFHHLISQRRPPVVFGEQVASKPVDAWIDLVQDDLEAVGYAVGAVPFPSAGVGAPHIRDRAWFVADAAKFGSSAGTRESGVPFGSRKSERQIGPRVVANSDIDRCDQGRGGVPSSGHDGLVGDRSAGIVGITSGARPQGIKDGRRDVFGSRGAPAERAGGEPSGRMADGWLGDANCQLERRISGGEGASPSSAEGKIRIEDGQRDGAVDDRTGAGRSAGPTNGFWRDPDWLFCRDGKWRPVEPGTSPLTHGAPARVGRLRAYGNAINAEAAAAFIQSYLTHGQAA